MSDIKARLALECPRRSVDAADHSLCLPHSLCVTCAALDRIAALERELADEQAQNERNAGLLEALEGEGVRREAAEQRLAALRRRFADMEAKRNALFEEATALRRRHAEAVEALRADLDDMARQRDQWKEFAYKHPEVTPPVVTQEIAALRQRHAEALADGYVLAMRLLQSDIIADDTERVAMEHFLEAKRGLEGEQ